jgi:putative ABC transport system substrate-binding protein
MPVIGFLSVYSPPTDPSEVAQGPVREGLKETGFVEGQNMSIERRWAEGHYDRLPAIAADLVSRKVDLIVTSGGTRPVLAAKSATSTIPIVFTGLSDPVGKGLVASLARPGGNITGFSNFAGELTPKRLELLSELVPQATVICAAGEPGQYPEQCGRAVRKGQASGGSREVGPASGPEGSDRGRNRHCFRLSRPTASRRTRRRIRCVLHKPARATLGASITLCCTGDL